MRQLPLAMELQAPPTLETYLPGPNAAAVQAVRAFLERTAGPLAGQRPLLLWGDGGCGKTHLLCAARERWLAQGGAVLAFGAHSALPWTVPAERVLVLLDDVQDLGPERQHAAFGLFVQAAGGGLSILAASDRPPVDLPLREDLRTRLGWGEVWHLQPLPDEELPAALRQEARRRGWTLPDEVIHYLLVRRARDLRQLMGLLARLDRYALSLARPVTIPLFKQMLAEEGQAP